MIWQLCGIAPERSDEIEWMECRLGEKTREGLRRIPYNEDRLRKEVHLTAQRSREIDWAFAIEFAARPGE